MQIKPNYLGIRDKQVNLGIRDKQVNQNSRNEILSLDLEKVVGLGVVSYPNHFS